MKKVLTINGSTRKQWTNHALIDAIAELSTTAFSIERFESLMQLPHFNPDDDRENVHGAVSGFRARVRQADGVLICTPEYAAGVPGTLKNALDWCVSTTVFSNKPVALITASSMGERGHASLLETLRIIECHTPDELQLLIPFAKTKIDRTGIKDPTTLSRVQQLIEGFSGAINER
ncbi:MAG TPA: NADPH-dependent FMN reductase [Chitinophagales bacterium]|nr:NADPH-dependent FMN reductase [Chitinophagales bacterium]